MALQYPKGFPEPSIGRVEKELVLAGRSLPFHCKEKDFVKEALRVAECFGRELLPFARENAEKWDARKFREAIEEFRDGVVHELYWKYGRAKGGPDPYSSWGQADWNFLALRRPEALVWCDDLVLDFADQSSSSSSEELAPDANAVSIGLSSPESRKAALKKTLERWRTETNQQFTLEDVAAICKIDRSTLSHWLACRVKKEGLLREAMPKVLRLTGQEAVARLSSAK